MFTEVHMSAITEGGMLIVCGLVNARMLYVYMGKSYYGHVCIQIAAIQP